MPRKRKSEKIEPTQGTGGCCSEAISFASDTAESVAELGTDSLEGARKAVRARPLTTAMLTLGAGAIIGTLFLR